MRATKGFQLTIFILSFFFVAINGSSQLLDKTDEVFGTQVSLDMLPMAFLGKF
jgi:hypothetical protein